MGSQVMVLIFIPMVLFLTGATYFSVNGLLGFPTIQSLPEKFLINDISIEYRQIRIKQVGSPQ